MTAELDPWSPMAEWNLSFRRVLNKVDVKEQGLLSILTLVECEKGSPRRTYDLGSTSYNLCNYSRAIDSIRAGLYEEMKNERKEQKKSLATR